MRNQPKYKFLKNWGYAMSGLREIYKNESSFRLELAVFTPLFISLFFWNFEPFLTLFVLFAMVLVLVLECINSAIERIFDLASPEFHHLAGAAKDAGSTAVMICNFLCGSIWIYAIWSKFYG